MSEPNEQKPLWVNETPEANYRIFMGDGEGSEVQGIEMTRDEYEQLKQRLAELRGHLPRVVPMSEEDWDGVKTAYENLKLIVGGRPNEKEVDHA